MVTISPHIPEHTPNVKNAQTILLRHPILIERSIIPTANNK